MASMRLTDRSVRSLRVKRGQRVRRAFDKITKGLAIQCTASGAKSFYFVYRSHSRKVWHFLGELKDLSLADARDDVQKHRSGLLDGVDPRLEKRRALGAKTFDQLAKTFVEHLREKGKKSWRNYWRVLVGGPLPDAKRVVTSRRKSEAVALSKLWKDRPISDIRRADVRDMFEDVQRRAPIHANRVFAYTRQAFKFALNREWIESSPCADALDKSDRTEERSRTRVLTDAEIKKLWTALDKQPPVIADVVRTLLLTGQRSGEVFRMKWNELDANGWWTLPETRTKNGLAHRVYLTKSVRDILERRHRNQKSEWVFRSPKRTKEPIGSIAKAVARLVKITAVEFRPHDLRRTMATLAPRAGVPELTIPKMLGHVPPGITRKHYNLFDYADEKKRGWELWEKEIGRILRTKDERKRSGRLKVVPLFARSKSA